MKKPKKSNRLTESGFRQIKQMAMDNKSLTAADICRATGWGETTVRTVLNNSDYKSYRDEKWLMYAKHFRKVRGYEPDRPFEPNEVISTPPVELKSSQAYLDGLFNRLDRNIETLKETIGLVIEEVVKSKIEAYDLENKVKIEEANRVLEQAKANNWTNVLRSKFGGSSETV